MWKSCALLCVKWHYWDPISFNISMLFTQNLHSLNASWLTITLEFQLTLPNTHSYKYMVLNRAWSPNTACVDTTFPTIPATNLTWNNTVSFWYLGLSVICVVFLWSVSIDKAYLNVLVVISKLLGQFILGMRQLPRMNILVFKKRLVASSKSIIREKVNVIFVTIVNKAFSVWPYYFNNQHPLRPKW